MIFQQAVVGNSRSALLQWDEVQQARLRTDRSEQMKLSLVYLNISTHSYNQIQPWKHSDVNQTAGYGCAVSAYEVLTTANNLVDASFIKARRYGQNEFIPAKIKFLDYESNLALLELEADSMIVRFDILYPSPFNVPLKSSGG